MYKIGIISKYDMSKSTKLKTIELPGVPDIGHTIPLFYNPSPKVQEVIWMIDDPDMVGDESITNLNIDVLLIVK